MTDQRSATARSSRLTLVGFVIALAPRRPRTDQAVLLPSSTSSSSSASSPEAASNSSSASPSSPDRGAVAGAVDPSPAVALDASYLSARPDAVEQRERRKDDRDRDFDPRSSAHSHRLPAASQSGIRPSLESSNEAGN